MRRTDSSSRATLKATPGRHPPPTRVQATVSDRDMLMRDSTLTRGAEPIGPSSEAACLSCPVLLPPLCHCVAPSATRRHSNSSGDACQ